MILCLFLPSVLLTKFELQDNDTNYHMDFIARLANMKARNYSTGEVDKLKAKFIAGRIIPAIAATTAMATGLVCLELYKVLAGGHKVEDYQLGSPIKVKQIPSFASLFLSYQFI
ncbi:hypothetical protein FXO38_23899 [Capsicum annuum]|nr:hypothetical protein FXO38_23899 [Capsicum annuum]KAF3680353.1 hypothetical protein FXO37_03363 [Capsicum annuum]